jgi:hypothetical protein
MGSCVLLLPVVHENTAPYPTIYPAQYTLSCYGLSQGLSEYFGVFLLSMRPEHRGDFANFFAVGFAGCF